MSVPDLVGHTTDRGTLDPMTGVDSPFAHGLAHEFSLLGREITRRSPLYGAVCEGIAAAPDVIELLHAAPVAHRRPVQLLAALHHRVLDDPHHPLRAHYPSTGGTPGHDVVEVALNTCRDDRTELQRIIATRGVQTNEVGRAPILMTSLRHLVGDDPIDLVDLGTSAGLTLLGDRYSSDLTDATGVSHVSWGNAQPTLVCGIRNEHAWNLEPAPTIVGRGGLDPDPIRMDDADGLRWLDACVWPDQHDRRARLRAAITTATLTPPELHTGRLPDDLATVADLVHNTSRPAITTSWALAYLTPEERRATLQTITQIITERDAVAVMAESPEECPDIPWPDTVRGSRRTEVIGGYRTSGRSVMWAHLGTAHPHGVWFHLASRHHSDA